METINLIRMILGCIFIFLGLILFAFEVYGVFKLKYTLDRMHLSGTGDTMGLLLTIIGAMLINGWDFTNGKLLLILVFFWFASPVSSHLISRLVVNTDEDLKDHVTIYSEEESKEILEGRK
jgi:multicomponent Na+:H+ antiporter subunit G